MSECSGKHRKMYVDYLKGKSKPTFLINGPVHSSDECKFLVEFGSNYEKSGPTNDRGSDPANRSSLTVSNIMIILLTVKLINPNAIEPKG